MRQGQIAIAITLGLAVAFAGSISAKTADEQELEATMKEHGNDSPVASPMTSYAPAQPVSGAAVVYHTVDGQEIEGWLARPDNATGNLPALIVIHEWWGLNDNIRSTADRLAGEGYIVFAVDLFSGGVASSPAEARELMVQVVEDPEAANDNLRAAYEFVTEIVGAPRVGSLGWSFGGAWSLNTARLYPEELDAIVIYYGQVTDDEAILRPINAPILGLFAEGDTDITVASVEAFRDALNRLRKNYEVHIYPEVGNAFANPTDSNYDPATAEDAWQRTLEFLKHHLSINE